MYEYWCTAVSVRDTYAYVQCTLCFVSYFFLVGVLCSRMLVPGTLAFDLPTLVNSQLF